MVLRGPVIIVGSRQTKGIDFRINVGDLEKKGEYKFRSLIVVP